MDLIIVRHALPERSDGVDATADPPLTDHGRRQAAATADFLAEESIDHVASSPLLRALQTAEPLADRLGLTIETVEGFREIDPFGGAYVPTDQLTMDHPVVQTFLENPEELFRNSGGIDEFRSTVVDAFDGIVSRNQGRRVAVFCHGTVIGIYLAALSDHGSPHVLMADYCGIYRVQAASNGIRTVRSANETGHVRALLG